jgi:hypothetical protein
LAYWQINRIIKWEVLSYGKATIQQKLDQSVHLDVQEKKFKYENMLFDKT